MAEILDLLPVLVFAGLLAGFLSGLLGIGGGIVMVPVLFWAYSLLDIGPDVPMHAAVATALVIVLATVSVSARSHARRNAVLFKTVKTWGPAMAFGGLLGGFLADYLSAFHLVMLFAFLAIMMGLRMILLPNPTPMMNGLPEGFKGFGSGTVVGTLAAMMGIGGATFIVPLMRLGDIPIQKAIGTAAMLGVFVAVPGVLAYAFLSGYQASGFVGHVHWPSVLVVAPVAMVMAPLGVKTAHALSRRPLEIIFGLFLILASLRLLYGQIL